MPPLSTHNYGQGPLQPSPPQIYPKMEMITLPGGGKLNVAEYVTPAHHTGVHMGGFQFPSQTLRYLEPQPSRSTSADRNRTSHGQSHHFAGSSQQMENEQQQEDPTPEDAAQESSMQEDGGFQGGMFAVEGHALLGPHGQGGSGAQQQLPHMASSFSSEAFLHSGLPSAISHGYDAGLQHLPGIGHFMGPQTPQSSNPLQLDSAQPSPAALPGAHPHSAIPHSQDGQLEPASSGGAGQVPNGLQAHPAGSAPGGQNGAAHSSSERIRRQQAIVDQCMDPVGSAPLQQGSPSGRTTAPFTTAGAP